MIRKGNIIEVPFSFPDGAIKKHPAMVVSDAIVESDGTTFFYVLLISTKNLNPKYTVQITSEMTNIPLPKKSYFVTHLIDRICMEKVSSVRGCFVKTEYYEKIMTTVFRNIFGYQLGFK